jgi:RNA recognition motif-containing protein
VVQSVRISELKQVFGRFGTVNDVYQPLNRARNTVHNYAFIKFDEREAAEAAIKGMDNTSLHDGCVSLLRTHKNTLHPNPRPPLPLFRLPTPGVPPQHTHYLPRC